jgi:hypothetical protein
MRRDLPHLSLGRIVVIPAGMRSPLTGCTLTTTPGQCVDVDRVPASYPVGRPQVTR